MSDKIIGLILSGGAGSRMGGVDKGLFEYQQKPLVDWVIEALAPQCDSLMISCNRNIERYQQRGLILIEDEGNNSEPSFQHQGPLAGIVQAIKPTLQQQADYLIVSPCDTPHIPSDLVFKLHRHLVDNKADVAVAHDGKRRHNLHFLIKTNCLNSLKNYYELNKGRAIKDWFPSKHYVEVRFPDASAFTNINQLN